VAAKHIEPAIDEAEAGGNGGAVEEKATGAIPGRKRRD